MAKKRTRRLELRITKLWQLVAGGMSERAACEAVTPKWAELSDQTKYNIKHELTESPLAQNIRAEVLRNIHAVAVTSHADYLTRVQRDIEEAKTADNWTAVAALRRIEGQTLGHVRESFTVDNRTLTDEQLIARFKAINPDLAVTVAKLMGRDTFDPPKPAEPKPGNGSLSVS